MQTKRTTLNLPTQLIKKAQKSIGASTKTDAIVIALKEAIQSREISELVDELAGVDGLDLTTARHKKLRNRANPS